MSKDRTKYGVKIKNISAGTLYMYNLGLRDMGSLRKSSKDAMLVNSLLLDFLKENGLKIKKNGSTEDVIGIDFDHKSYSYDDEVKKLKSKISEYKAKAENKDNTEKEKQLYNNQIEFYSSRLKFAEENSSLFCEKSVDDIRKEFYNNGVDVTYNTYNKDGSVKNSRVVHYKMLYRSAGKAKQGNCIFIKQSLWEKTHNFMYMGYKMPKHNAPIVEMGVYASLIASGIVGKIKIDPQNILVIKDVDSFFKTDVVSVELGEDKHCVAIEKSNYELKNTLFDGQGLIDSSIFYPQLFQYGNQDDNQYFLPVSFNLPAVIFSKKHEDMIPEDFILTTDQIRDTAALFNKQNDSGIYTSMGFAPSWDPEFLYLIARLKETNFRPFNNNFLWNSENLEDTVSYIKYWTETYNTSVQAEQDYEFKYLYTPPIKQIIADSCLFAYTTSAQIFSASEEDLQQIDFRWIHKDNNLPVEEDMLLLGIYKKASNFLGAETFISWLMKEETQQEIMTRMDSMNLNISHFGIAGGFSAIRSVNEIIFPQHYKILLGNIPAAEYIQPPTPLPSQWKNIKNQIKL